MDMKNRMEAYEGAFQGVLPIRMPVVIRVDGRAFHTLLRKAKRPFDDGFKTAMDWVALVLMEEIQNARFAYTQSDEVSVLLVDYTRFESEQWFGGNIQKMVSISASVASVAFGGWWEQGVFDSRVIPIPERDIVNYFIWRQRDWERNSIQMVARTFYSHGELLGKNCDEQQEMIFQKGVNWNDYPTHWKRGRVVTKGSVDEEIPIFSRDREYIGKFLRIEED